MRCRVGLYRACILALAAHAVCADVVWRDRTEALTERADRAIELATMGERCCLVVEELWGAVFR